MQSEYQPPTRAGHESEATASAWVQRWASIVAPGSCVLDLACGTGRHARLFAARGCKVIAVDRDPKLARTWEDEANVEFIAADLETGAWPLGDARFDVIVVTNYLHRPLFPALLAALSGNGLLIYETFALGNAAFGRPSNPNFLLAPRELLDAFGSEMRVLAFEDGFSAQPKPAMVQRIAARKGEFHAVLPAELSHL
ncbi:MAG: class I SAM-dependent methyltransferase [Burkholderiaceae bacterium]